MGKNFPRITNLKESPELFEKTIKLIEKSFHYEAQNSFIKDFYPLMREKNRSNCFVMVDENENVIAHVGAKEKFLFVNNKKFSLTLLGGIAVDEAKRGEGNFQNLFQDVLAEKRSDTSLFLLWSDQEKLYKKYGFYLCGEQFELPQTKIATELIQTRYKSLSEDEKKTIHALYEKSFSQIYLTPQRDWSDLTETSADLFIRKDKDIITDYFLMNKGQDLGGIIYEYGSEDLTSWLKLASQYGRVWTGKEILPTESSQYQFFMAPGDTKLFGDLVREVTNQAMSIREINVMKQEVYFDFNEELLGLDVEEFLRGVFGPGVFEELEPRPLPIFLSGIDSI